MKKFLILLLMLFLVNTVAEAKDYTKINTRRIKKEQKFGVSNNYSNSVNKIQNAALKEIKGIKDPKLLNVADYTILTKEQIATKTKSDKEFYKKHIYGFNKVRNDNINKRAYGKDYGRIYKIVDRLARANNLTYMNWRVVFVAKPEDFNAYVSHPDCITLYSSVFDTFADNDDALAFIIGHEMGHSMLGHLQRGAEMQKRTNEISRITGFHLITGGIYLAKKYADLKEERDMEFAADLEGAKILLRAGYDLEKGSSALAYMYTMGNSYQAEFRSTHPLDKKRLENIAQNRKYFVEEQWKNIGLNNWYNSEPLEAHLSSDRASIVFGTNELSAEDYYHPETLEEIFTRYAYKSYIYGEYDKALKYLDKLISINPDNFVPYLYASYANEYLYKQTGNVHYLELSKTFANSAKRLAPDNKYVIEQEECL